MKVTVVTGRLRKRTWIRGDGNILNCFQVFTTTVIKIMCFGWLHRVRLFRRDGGTFCLHLQCDCICTNVRWRDLEEEMRRLWGTSEIYRAVRATTAFGACRLSSFSFYYLRLNNLPRNLPTKSTQFLSPHRFSVHLNQFIPLQDGRSTFKRNVWTKEAQR